MDITTGWRSEGTSERTERENQCVLSDVWDTRTVHSKDREVTQFFFFLADFIHTKGHHFFLRFYSKKSISIYICITRLYQTSIFSLSVRVFIFPSYSGWIANVIAWLIHEAKWLLLIILRLKGKVNKCVSERVLTLAKLKLAWWKCRRRWSMRRWRNT